jgi:repressor LexA
MKGLTKRQKMVLDFIIQRIGEVGYPPTIREIGEHMAISSTNGVSDHLRALVRKGYLVRDESKSRALRPIQGGVTKAAKPKRGLGVGSAQVETPRRGGRPVAEIPLVGQIAAGQPILAHENVEESLAIDAALIGRVDAQLFALRVKGDSMVGDGIHNGDVIFVRKQQTAKRGDIVAVMIEGEATVKRFYPGRDHIQLKPSNPAMQPIVVRKEEFKDTVLLGVVVGLFRKFD